MDGGEVWIEILEAKWFERYLHTEHFNILKKNSSLLQPKS